MEMIQTSMFIDIVVFIYFSINHFILFFVSFNLVFKYPITKLFCISSSAFSFWKCVVFCIYEYSKHLVISEMPLSGAKFPEVWEIGGSKKPGVSKKPKNKKKQYFKTLSAEAPSAKTSGKLFFLVCLFFLFFGNPRIFGTTKFPNLWKIVFFGISEYSKHLVQSEMSLSVAKVTEKHLQIIASIWCKISRKNICKSMENRTLRDTRSVCFLVSRSSGENQKSKTADPMNHSKTSAITCAVLFLLLSPGFVHFQSYKHMKKFSGHGVCSCVCFPSKTKTKVQTPLGPLSCLTLWPSGLQFCFCFALMVFDSFLHTSSVFYISPNSTLNPNSIVTAF